MAFSKDDIRNLAGGSVTGSDGTKIGEISQFYLSDSTGEPTWATVKTGLFGTQESFVPLSGATVEGNELHVAYDKAAVREAPRVDTDGHLTLEEEANLYRHYGISDESGPERAVDSTGRDGQPDQVSGDSTEPVSAAAAGRRTDGEEGDTSSGRMGHGQDSRDDEPTLGSRTRPTGEDRDAEAPTRPDADEARMVDENSGDRAGEGPAVAEDVASDGSGDQGLDALKPGETRTRLRRYVVTERVIQTVEELPDEP
jgi:hypothetical protein